MDDAKEKTRFSESRRKFGVVSTTVGFLFPNAYS